MTRFFLGLDLGQASDSTAICILERGAAAAGRTTYQGRHLERVPLGTPYPAIADQVATMLDSEALRGRTALVVDATGVGRPVLDMLEQRRLRPIGITITGGDSAHYEQGMHRVPKRDLIGTLQVLLQTERLKFAASLREVPVLIQELQNFRVKINPATAHDSYEHRVGQHDDLVLACAVAAWYAERPEPRRVVSRSFSQFTVG